MCLFLLQFCCCFAFCRCPSKILRSAKDYVAIPIASNSGPKSDVSKERYTSRSQRSLGSRIGLGPGSQVVNSFRKGIARLQNVIKNIKIKRKHKKTTTPSPVSASRHHVCRTYLVAVNISAHRLPGSMLYATACLSTNPDNTTHQRTCINVSRNQKSRHPVRRWSRSRS